MYARVLRKWSLNTKLMSSVWLAVAVTMLLLFVCVPAAALAAATRTSSTTTTMSQSSAYADMSRLIQPARAAAEQQQHQQQQQHPAATIWDIQDSAEAPIAAAESAESEKFIKAATATAQHRENAGVAEENYYIRVANQEDSNSISNSNIASNNINNNKNVVSSNNYANRLINKLSSGSTSGSSSSISSSSSSSKIFSSSRLSSSNNQQHRQQQQQQRIPAKYDDSLVYSYYYKTPQPPPTAPAAVAISAVFEKTKEQPINVAGNIRDYNEENEDDKQELNDDEDSDEVQIDEEEIDNDDEDEDDDDGDNEVATVGGTTATLMPASATAYKQKVPNVSNSQIINLLNNYNNHNNQQNNFNQPQKQQSPPHQQQQTPTNVAHIFNMPNTAKRVKARRHIPEISNSSHQLQSHARATTTTDLRQKNFAATTSQQQQQHQQQLQLQHYHNAMRATGAMRSRIMPAALTLSSSSTSTSTSTSPATLASATSPLSTTSANDVANNKVSGNLAPYRYIIEAFEIPASLPYTTREFTAEQRHMLLMQQQKLLLLQQQQAQELAARNRRDSRAFRHMPNQQQQQQQQQQQHFERLESDISNSDYHKLQHHHNHHGLQRQHQQQHRHPRRYCSARDPAQLAFEAPTVFEGRIVSMTRDRRANFSATVEVREIFKQQIGFRLQKLLRLQFAYRNSSGGECDIYREQLRARGLVSGNELEPRRYYLMFVQQIDSRNFTILGQPIRKTRRVVEAVKNAVSENYAQLASIRSITASNQTVENGKELRIVCKVQGRPPPKVTWFKDHKSINRNRKLYQFVHFKKRSELVIRSFNSSDAGRYECRAKNKVNRNLERRAIVIKAYPVPRYETHMGGTGNNCPDDVSEFCFNGGTCKFFSEIGSYSCICPEGFIGERCDRKEVNNMPPNHVYKTGYIADDSSAYVQSLKKTSSLP